MYHVMDIRCEESNRNCEFLLGVFLETVASHLSANFITSAGLLHSPHLAGSNARCCFPASEVV